MVLFFGSRDGRYQPIVHRLARDWGVQEFRTLARDSDPHTTSTVYDTIDDAEFVLIWNGWQYSSPLVAQYCRRHAVPHAFMEFGVAPQRETYTVDPRGFCGDSVLNDPLGWIDDGDRERMRRVRERMREQAPPKDGQEVLVPLQIEKDTQVAQHSPYRSMDEFVGVVVDRWPGCPIRVRPHPKSPKGTEWLKKYGDRVTLDRSESIEAAVSRAAVVVGITSTTLYEAAIYGVPVLAMGDHPLRSHPPMRHDDVVAGALALTIPRTGEGISGVLRRFGLGPREVRR